MTDPAQKPIDLALEPVFRIGTIEVHPAALELRAHGTSHTLEPRVMQVLVLLAQSDGVVSRDTLVARCWNGRVVGDAAINRAISQLRKLAAQVGDRSFDIETITKVGYRLVTKLTPTAMPSPAVATPPPSAITRRKLLVAAAGVGAVSTIVYAMLRNRRSNKSAEDAAALYKTGIETLRQGLREQTIQAVAYFSRATDIAPDFAPAWGGLALAHSMSLDDSDDAEFDAIISRCRSAAQRAQVLDPGNADARAALIALRPLYRNWAAVEKDLLGALRLFPEHWALQHFYGKLLAEVGRVTDSVAVLQALKKKDPYLPNGRWYLIHQLWAAGLLQDVERELDEASTVWPAHLWLWIARFNFLALSGKPGEALALAANPSKNPIGFSPVPINLAVTLAQALHTRTKPAFDHAMETLKAARAQGLVATPPAVMYLAAFGETDLAFEWLDKLYPDGPKAAKARRFTNVLFAAATAPLRPDARFAALTERIGLEEYWRSTQTVPFFRQQPK